MNSDTALIIFIKNPIKGKVKTRLAKTVGEEKAFVVYEKLLAITRREGEKCNCTRYLFYSNTIITNDAWDNNKFLKHIQIGDNLGERMQHAFEFVFKLGHKKAIIIGSDCPTITTDLINKADEHLNNNDVVFGPAKDGGYYLLAMNQLVEMLFENMPWSKGNLLAQSLKKLEENQLSYHLLKQLNDIDNEEDWLDYLRISSNGD